MNLGLQKIFQEMLYIMDWMDEMKVLLLSQDYGKHLLGVEDLLQKHALVEADIAIQAERVRGVNASAQKFATDGEGYKPCDPQVIRSYVSCQPYVVLAWKSHDVFGNSSGKWLKRKDG